MTRASEPRVAAAAIVLLLSACAAPSAPTAPAPAAAREEIFILRSIRERQQPTAGWCSSSARAGFEPFPADAEHYFSFWSLRLQPEDGRVVDAKDQRVAELRGCFGATTERARQNFYAEVRLGTISFRGKGECLALATDFPQAGLFPVRCQLVLSGLPAPYVGGLLTTNTMTSKARLRRRHRSVRLHPGLDRLDSPVEIRVGRVRPDIAVHRCECTT
jgi:hypothetical protein